MNLPGGVPVPVAAAFVIEAALLFLLSSDRFRQASLRIVLAILASGAVLTYALASFDTFSAGQAAQLILLSLAPSLWLIALPRSKASDLLLLFALAAIFLSPAFRDFYGGKWHILGRAMWVRSGVAAFLVVAKEPGIGFGFWPSRSDWITGARYFLLFLGPGLALGWALGYLRAPEPRPLQGLGMFFGSLWFVALSEEFFFRGLIQRWIGLPAASVLFGLAHLGFRQFPNWRHVAMTVLLGVFCGLAYRHAGSIRAAIVTHSLVNAMWVGVLGKL